MHFKNLLYLRCGYYSANPVSFLKTWHWSSF